MNWVERRDAAGGGYRLHSDPQRFWLNGLVTGVITYATDVRYRPQKLMYMGKFWMAVL